MIRLMFLISVLNRGGAEHQLTLLAKGIDKRQFSVTVLTVYDGGPLLQTLLDTPGIEVLSLGKKGRGDYVRPIWRLLQIMRRSRPDIVHGYMGVANIMALLAGKPFGAKVVWGLRSSVINFALYDRLSAWYFRLAATLSRFADLIIANSYAGKSHHVAEGYSGRHMVVIPNGFDTDYFRPDAVARERMRATWAVPDDALLIGLVARLDPTKDHVTFLHAAALIAAEFDHVRFVCVGGGPDSLRKQLLELGVTLGLADRVIWTGELGDLPAVQNALDIATSSTAFGEGFSNTVGEAMACGVPCVVTDVGDSARIVGSTGLAVPFGDPTALALAWRSLIEMPEPERRRLGEDARNRIVASYSLDSLTRRTEHALACLWRQGASPQAPTPDSPETGDEVLFEIDRILACARSQH